MERTANKCMAHGTVAIPFELYSYVSYLCTVWLLCGNEQNETKK